LKHRTIKRIVTLGLALIMCLGILPIYALSEEMELPEPPAASTDAAEAADVAAATDAGAEENAAPAAPSEGEAMAGEQAGEPAEEPEKTAEAAPEEKPETVSAAPAVEEEKEPEQKALTTRGNKYTEFTLEAEGSFAAVSVTGSYKNREPSLRAAAINGADGLAVLEAWTVEDLKNNTEANICAVITALPELNEGESLAFYSVADDELYELVRGGLTAGDEVDFALEFKGVTGVAVVRLGAEEEDEPEKLVDGSIVWANDDVYLTGRLPEGAIVDAEPVTVTIDGREALAAYDIKIYRNEKKKARGKTWQPAGHKIQVHFYADRFGDGELNVYHMQDADAPAELVDTVTASEGWVSFPAESFSIYAIGEGAETDNKRIAYRFWTYDPRTERVQLLDTQYFRYKDLHPDPGVEPLTLGEPSFAGLITEEEINVHFDRWYEGSFDGTGAATLGTVKKTMTALREELTARPEADFDEREINLFAKMNQVFYVTYLGKQNSVLKTDSRLVTNGEASFTALTVADLGDIWTYEEQLQNWFNVENITQTYTPGTTYTITSDLTLLPQINTGAWLIFDDNDLVNDGTGKMVSGGASYTPPVFYEHDVNTVRPTPDPEWDGYTFDYWYNNDETEAFSFGSPLTGNTILHAHWTPDASRYSIVYMKQIADDEVNAADADKHYEYAGSRVVTEGVVTGEGATITDADTRVFGADGLAGSGIYADIGAEDKEFFTYNGALTGAANANAVVKNDGSTVLYVYYDRVPITIHFTGASYTYEEIEDVSSYTGTTVYGYVDGNFVALTGNATDGWTYGNYHVPYSEGKFYERSALHSQLTLQGLYGHSIDIGEWPVPQNTQQNTQKWWQYRNSNNSTVKLNSPWTAYRIPDKTLVVNMTLGDANPNVQTMIYWGEDIEGNFSIVLEESYRGDRQTGMTDDKFYGYHGYGWRYGDGAIGSGDGWTAFTGSIIIPKANEEERSKTLNLYYARDKFTLTFRTNNATGEDITVQNVPYEKPLDGYAGQDPGEGRSNCFFAGWYADPGYTIPFDFSQTMPHNNVVIYGCWKVERFRIVIVPGAENVFLGENQADRFRVDYGDEISGTLGSAERPGYTLAGWYLDSSFSDASHRPLPITVNWDLSDYIDKNYLNEPQLRELYEDTASKYNDVRNLLYLYAKWTPDLTKNGYVVIYDPGEAATPQTTVPIDRNLYQGNNEVRVLGDPTDYNPLYVFDGWKIVGTNGEPQGDLLKLNDPIVLATTPFVTDQENPNIKNVRLVAIYHKKNANDPNYTTVTFNGNRFTVNKYTGGSETLTGKTLGGADEVTIEIDQRVNHAIPLKGNDDFYLPGFTLIGWSKVKKDDNQYAENEYFTLDALISADNIGMSVENSTANTLYAVWEPKTYTVTVNQVMHDDITGNVSYSYNYSKGKATPLAQLNENGSVTRSGDVSVISEDGLYYYEYFGNTFSIAPGTYPENACYEVEATAKLDDGSTVVITPEDDTYRINGDITITFHFRKLPAPTGFTTRLAPYALLVAAGGCVLVTRIKKRRGEEADEA